jgi:ubiquinone/menaquinone biosynthesis C-methylase UbiE
MINVVADKWRKNQSFWQSKMARQGVSYVGRVGEDHHYQAKMIERLYWGRVGQDAYFTDALDFGCGYGRFAAMLSNSCGHVWAVDMLEEMLSQVRGSAPNVTPIRCTWPPRLVNHDNSMDLLWACLVFQHIVDDDLFTGTMKELSRLLKPGARVIIIDNAVDHAHHVKPRGPEVLMKALNAKIDYADKVTINKRTNDHWLIDGKVH